MNVFPGDTFHFTLPIHNSDGSNPNVTSAPSISVVKVSDSSVVTGPTVMALISGTEKIYKFSWDTTGEIDGDYVGIVSYAADGNTFTGHLVDRVRLGDSRITDVVAKETTVAKDATVAKNATVMKAADFVSPDASPIVQQIRDKTDALPSDPVSETSLAALDDKVEDIHDNALGKWRVDKAANTLTKSRKNDTVLKVFNITNNGAESTRNPV